jgi:hypothetical protein
MLKENQGEDSRGLQAKGLWQRSESFGVAIRIGASSSMFNVESTKVIHVLLTFSPASDLMAREFLKELQKVSGIHDLVRF